MGIWSRAFQVESAVAQIISDQGVHGCNFDVKKAFYNVHILTEKIVRIDHKLVPMLPLMLNKGSTYVKPFVKSGAFSKYAGLYAERQGLLREEVGGPFSCIWYTPFDTSKNERMKFVMIDLGWRPADWTIKKNPLNDLRHLPPKERQETGDLILEKYIKKVILGHGAVFTNVILNRYGFGRRKRTYGVLKQYLMKEKFWFNGPKITPDKDTFEGQDEDILHLIRDRMIWAHRLSMMKGFIDRLWDRPVDNTEEIVIRLPRRFVKRAHLEGVEPSHLVKKTVLRIDKVGRLTGDANPDATPTHRMKHKTIVNVPAGRAPFGYRCRSLFMGDYDPTCITPIIVKHEIGEGVRVRNGTNLLEEFKKGKWVLCGKYKVIVPKGQQTFVGYDGAALELRMLAHYLVVSAEHLLKVATKSGSAVKIKEAHATLKSANDYKQQILEGDIHSHNQGLAGLPTRDSSKTFIYAFLK